MFDLRGSWRSARGPLAILLLAGATVVACGGSDNPGGPVQSQKEDTGTDLDLDTAPLPGKQAPAPSTVPDPPALAGKVVLPPGSAEQIAFYFTLPIDESTLVRTAEEVTEPGSASYRHFLSYEDAARIYGASGDDMVAAIKAVERKGLKAFVDPSRTFVRVVGTSDQWNKSLGAPLKVIEATADAPFDFYELPKVPKFDKLTYVRAGATVYRSDVDGGVRSTGAGAAEATSSAQAAPWPLNQVTRPSGTCVSGSSVAQSVFTPLEIATAYRTSAVRESVDTDAARVAVIDLGGGFKESDVEAAAECFGYAPPKIEVQTGDGVSGRIVNNNDETQLDLQTMAAIVPGGTIELIETANGSASLLDAVSRMYGDANGPPDAASISYGWCAVTEEEANHALVNAIARVVLLGNITGTSVFVSSGDSGSTMCADQVDGISQSFPASAPWVTAVGGTRLALGPGNERSSETVWNDSSYGIAAGGGGGTSKVFKRPWYQDALVTTPLRAVPDVAALAAIAPGWPVVIDGELGNIGGTSGASPFVAAHFGLLAARERVAGRPRIGFVNPWLYELFSQHPEAFHDVLSGSNDLNEVGCCTAAEGFDLVSGLGVPNWDVIAENIPPPAP